MLAPMLPMIERDRTMMPRTTPNDLTIRYPANSKVVVVRGCVCSILLNVNALGIEHHSLPEKKLIFPEMTKSQQPMKAASDNHGKVESMRSYARNFHGAR